MRTRPIGLPLPQPTPTGTRSVLFGFTPAWPPVAQDRRAVFVARPHRHAVLVHADSSTNGLGVTAAGQADAEAARRQGLLARNGGEAAGRLEHQAALADIEVEVLSRCTLHPPRRGRGWTRGGTSRTTWSSSSASGTARRRTGSDSGGIRRSRSAGPLCGGWPNSTGPTRRWALIVCPDKDEQVAGLLSAQRQGRSLRTRPSLGTRPNTRERQ